MPARTASVEPERELALLLAGTAASRERHRTRLRELASVADLAALEAFLVQAGMLALLGRRLEQVAGATLSERFRADVHAHAAQAQRQGVGQQLLTVRLVAALEEAGIRVLPLKGPLLGERLHGDAGARISADVDLLVARADLPRATELVIELGYRREGDARALPTLHERLVHPHELPDVELHWRVHWYEERFSAELLERSAPGPSGCLVPRPDEELALLLLLYARDGFAGLRLACDLAAWWDRHGAELGPGGVTQTAIAHPATARSLATAALLAERLVGLPAARVLSAELLAHGSAHAARLANWALRGSPAQISANVSLIDWLLAPSGQWRALTRRHLLLSRADLLRSWPRAGAGGRHVLQLRALHATRVACRYAIAAWALLRRRAWTPLPSSLGGSRAR
jgi:hypothetical protein